jgi:hypothetical protein
MRSDEICEVCWPYLQTGDLEPKTYFLSSYLGIRLNFTTKISLPGETGCNFLDQATLAKLGTNPICSFAQNQLRVDVMFGTGVTLNTGDAVVLK